MVIAKFNFIDFDHFNKVYSNPVFFNLGSAEPTGSTNSWQVSLRILALPIFSI